MQSFRSMFSSVHLYIGVYLAVCFALLRIFQLRISEHCTVRFSDPSSRTSSLFLVVYQLDGTRDEDRCIFSGRIGYKTVENCHENYAEDSGKCKDGFLCSSGHLVNHKQLDFISLLKHSVLWPRHCCQFETLRDFPSLFCWATLICL